MTNHAFMADLAVDRVKSPELRAVLAANRQIVLSGAAYPDSGYASRSAQIPGGDYGEISHWERFINAYAAHLRAKAGRGECGDRGLADPQGPCADLVAHLMGAAAHGMGDETWDWLFEPRIKDHGEQPQHPGCGLGPGSPQRDFPPCSLIENIEYAMDVVAIVDHNRWATIPSYTPDTAELVQVYRSIGENAITEDGIRGGHTIMTAAIGAERLGAGADSQRVRQQMPWSAANYYGAPGGVVWSSIPIAGYMDAVWSKLRGTHPIPAVVGIHPANGETGVPFRWQPPRTSPGPHTGGGETRLIAVLGNSILPASVTTETFLLFDEQGAKVPALAGFPKVGPYGGDLGTHSMLLYPSVDLKPCTRYTAVVTAAVRDHAGAGMPRDFRWTFKTRNAGTPPAPCPPPRPPGGGQTPIRVIELSVNPTTARAGRTTRFRFLATYLERGVRRRVGGAKIRFAKEVATTNSRGRAGITQAFTHPRSYRPHARAPGFKTGHARVRVVE